MKPEVCKSVHLEKIATKMTIIDQDTSLHPIRLSRKPQDLSLHSRRSFLTQFSLFCSVCAGRYGGFSSDILVIERN